ncbi:hypothetical protein TNCV_765751 [Trichonephila clavipes]|nr:hypothetical protein TNCV_765751 [Trichonephila clavipes]
MPPVLRSQIDAHEIHRGKGLEIVSPIFCERRIRWSPLSCKFKVSLPSSLGRRARFLGGQKGVALQVQDARVGVGSNKRCRLDVDVRRSDVTALALSYKTFPLRKV